MGNAGSALDWTDRWPAGAERVEVRDGRLMFELRGFHRSAWTAEDVAAAARCYEGQTVELSNSGAIMFIHPPALAGDGDGDNLPGKPPDGGAQQPRHQ